MQGRTGRVSFPFKGKEILAKALKDIEKGDLVYIYGGEWGFSPIDTGVTGISTSYYQHTVSCSSDGSIVACIKSAPYVYRRTGLTTWSSISLSENPSGTIRGVALSPSGRYLAFGTSSSPYLFVYEFTGTEYTARSLDSNPGATVYGLSFLSDDALALHCDASPYHLVYTTGTTFTRVDPDVATSLPAAVATVLIVNESCFAIFTTSGTSTTHYRWSFQNGTLTRISSISGPDAYVYAAARNYFLNIEAAMQSPSPTGYFSLGSLLTSPTLYRHGGIPYSIYGAAPTKSGFLLATSSDIIALDVLGDYTSRPNVSCRKLNITTSTCRGFAWNSDYTLYYTSVGGTLMALEASNLPCVVPVLTYQSNIYTLTLACALEDIPAGGIGSVFLVRR